MVTGLAEDGNWMWVSDFNWGWAPFHYGRWLWIFGPWMGWIPGRVYSHAWVVWRTGYYDDYYVGWAPMPPTWYWRSGYAYGLYYVPNHRTLCVLLEPLRVQPARSLVHRSGVTGERHCSANPALRFGRGNGRAHDLPHRSAHARADDG